MRLLKMELHNFQDHQDTTVEFLEQGMTVIVGDPNSGKTAIQRAFQWVANGEPLGFRFHYDYSDDEFTHVLLVLDSGICVKKIKSKRGGAHYYLWRNQLEEPEHWKGEKVPDEVREVLGLSDVNIQPQDQEHYLVTDGPLEVARTLNRITGVDKVDRQWMPALDKVLREVRADISAADKLRKAKEEELSALPSTEKTWKLIDRGTVLDGDIDQLDGDIDSLDARLLGLKTVKEELAKLPDIEQADRLVGRAGRRLRIISEAEEALQTINVFLEDGKAFEEERDFLQTVEPIADRARLESARLVALENSLEDLITQTRALQEAERALLTADGELTSAEDELQTVLKERGLCPTCGQPLTEDMVREIIEREEEYG